MIGRRRCPNCAERVRKEARTCRFCGHALPPLMIEEETHGVRYSIYGFLVLAAAIGLGYSLSPRLEKDPVEFVASAPEPLSSSAAEAAPAYEVLLPGATLEWTAAEALADVTRQVAPLVFTIRRKSEGELTAPLVEVRHGRESVTMEGELVGPSHSHRISALQVRHDGTPVIMLQSFSGGAHCCNTVQLAGISGGTLKVIELGTWDGDRIELPRDISGDGLADFIVLDNSFLYAFSAYAASHAPPKVLNVVDGKVVDVSSRPQFRKLFEKSMHESGEVCRTGESGFARNGACPAYVASAARVGKLGQAWSDMVAAYDARVDWTLPTGCSVSRDYTCPPGQEIVFKSYPEALLHFLKEQGYVSKSWQPAEFSADEPSDELTI